MSRAEGEVSVSTLVVETCKGPVAGRQQHGCRAFYGIPYAAPPVGDLRFLPPMPHAEWQGIRDATQPGPSAPQFVRAFPLDMSPLVGSGWTRGDDFLTANVWAPSADAVGHPVMVFIHGGAFALGSNNATVSDGAAFARSGVVCIALNYRVGIEGFLAAPGVPANLGLRDVVAGLRWVKENAAAFGGDPDNVTIFGESSGAMMIGLLLASEASKGLFRRAILESGHIFMFRAPEVGFCVTQHIAELLGATPDVDGFRGTSIEDCVGALQTAAQPATKIDLRNAKGCDPLFGISKISPITDNDWVLADPLGALAAGASSDVEVLVGTNRDEMNLYFVPTNIRKTLSTELAIALLTASHPQAEAVLSAYGLHDPDSNAGDVFAEAMTDLVFRAPARRFALAHRGPTHVYEFGWRSTACGGELGACHGLELPFVFDTLSTCTGATGVAGDHPPQELADSVHSLWVQFAKDGTLPWPEFDADTRAVYALEEHRWRQEPALQAEAFVVTQ